MSNVFYIGVDVGTSSVRSALVDSLGTVIKTCVKDIHVYTPNPGYYEQSSTEIWEACCHSIRNVTKEVSPDSVQGIGFDATCSLVVVDTNFNSVCINTQGEVGRDVIMWLDHRAQKQAEFINSTKHEVLRFVGGKISLEMQSPKLLWLKQNLPESWKKAAHFFDLPDFLTWKATGCLSRSMCSVVCKWTYLPKQGWSKNFWSTIGLPELMENNFEKLGSEINPIGHSVGGGISSSASLETSLNRGTPVATSIIDAHCGGIGAIGCSLEDITIKCDKADLSKRIALICGTSSCHMAISKHQLEVPGVWGPYLSVMIPEYWLNEGGQSAVASLLDHIVQSHPASAELHSMAAERKLHVSEYLNNVLRDMATKSELDVVDILTKDVHVWPDYHGNRSPLADPNMKGMICGLTLDKSIEGLALLYLAAMQALALGTNHILNVMKEAGHSFEVIFLTGGLQKNDIFVQIHSNATGLPIVLSRETESVLVGAAVLGACASGNETLESAMNKMCHVGRVIQPQENTALFYKKKYQIFLKMAEHQKEIRDIMASPSS